MHQRPSRWYLLETIQAYGLAALVRYGETDRAARRHAEYFRDLFMPPSSGLNMRLSDADLVSRIREIDNVRAALDWPFSTRGDKDVGRDLTAAYALVWLHRALNSECRERCRTSAARSRARWQAKHVAAHAVAKSLATALCPPAGKVGEQARSMATEAFEFAEVLGDFDTQVWALATLAVWNGYGPGPTVRRG